MLLIGMKEDGVAGEYNLAQKNKLCLICIRYLYQVEINKIYCQTSVTEENKNWQKFISLKTSKNRYKLNNNNIDTCLLKLFNIHIYSYKNFKDIYLYFK